ncbi:hypothetical protein TNCV_2818471 [Trichonephila clavipes]|nr:hypothetical protein TNCV_2818471 [Trichonephila clavipes]
MWDALERQVAGRNYHPTHKNTLIRALTEEWGKLPQQLLDNVVQSMVRIIRAQMPPFLGGNWASKLLVVIGIRLYGAALNRDISFREVGTIVENSACVEAGTTISQTPAKRCQFEQFQLYYLRRGEITHTQWNRSFSSIIGYIVRASNKGARKKKVGSFHIFSKMYKNALKEDLIRVVEDLDGTVESTDTIAKQKTKIENSSTFESDPDFVKTLIKNCIDERVSRNEREVTLEKQKN